jgi:hypothetical protein
MKKCVKKISVVCVVAIAMSMIFSSLAFASQSSSSSQAASFSVQDREAILATPAYAIPKVIQGNGVPNQGAINAIKQHNKDLETYYLSLSDAQFNSALQAALQNIANRSNSGENIVWNKDFVKNIVKPKFPGLYATISSQESKNSKIVSGSITDPDVTFDSLVYDSFG